MTVEALKSDRNYQDEDITNIKEIQKYNSEREGVLIPSLSLMQKFNEEQLSQSQRLFLIQQ